MSYSIVTISSFEKELKHLAKKYPSIKNDLAELVNNLISEPRFGEQLGNHCCPTKVSKKMPVCHYWQ